MTVTQKMLRGEPSKQDDALTSAEVARVKEVTPVRTFIVENDDGAKSIVAWVSPPTEKFAPNGAGDTLFCERHQAWDGCTCTARVRLCGILTNTVAVVRRTKARAPGGGQ